MVIVQETFIVMVTARQETWTWEGVNMRNWAINCDMGNKSLGFIMLSIPCAFLSSEMCLCSSSLYANTMLDVIVILWFQSRFDRVTSGQVCHWTCSHLINPMTQKYIYSALNPEPLCLKCLFTNKTFCFELDGHLNVAWVGLSHSITCVMGTHMKAKTLW